MVEVSCLICQAQREKKFQRQLNPLLCKGGHVCEFLSDISLTAELHEFSLAA